jgi:hypothetical protein
VHRKDVLKKQKTANQETQAQENKEAA